MTLGMVELTVGALGLLALGLVVGWLLGGLVGRRERDSLKESLRAAEEAITQFRSDARDHFDRAEELFTDLTERYVAYSRHLASGAAVLASERVRSFPSISVSLAPSLAESAPTELDRAGGTPRNGSAAKVSESGPGSWAAGDS